MGRMNKRMNSLSHRGFLITEQAEHGLGKTPTMEEARRNEMKEHGLKGIPTEQKIFQAEAIEHGSSMGPIVVKGTRTQRQQATQAYKNAK
jgi:hypothetical protein